MLPAALAIALSPFPLRGIVLILSGKAGRRNGPLFAAGWIIDLSVTSALVASCTVLGAVGAHLVGGRRAAAFLDGVGGFMVANSTVITVLVLLLLGAGVLGDGLSGLGR